MLLKFGCFFRKIVNIQGYFIKLTFTRSGSSFAKLSSMDCGLISSKFEGCFVKFTSPTVPSTGDEF